MPFTDQGVGYQKTDTSRKAAEDQRYRARTIRDAVLLVLQDKGRAMTTEEIASALRKPYGSVQPRLSELQDRRLVRDSGSRGQTQWGKACIKWVLYEENKQTVAQRNTGLPFDGPDHGC